MTTVNISMEKIIAACDAGIRSVEARQDFTTPQRLEGQEIQLSVYGKILCNILGDFHRIKGTAYLNIELDEDDFNLLKNYL